MNDLPRSLRHLSIPIASFSTCTIDLQPTQQHHNTLTPSITPSQRQANKIKRQQTRANIPHSTPSIQTIGNPDITQHTFAPEPIATFQHSPTIDAPPQPLSSGARRLGLAPQQRPRATRPRARCRRARDDDFRNSDFHDYHDGQARRGDYHVDAQYDDVPAVG